MELAMTLMTLLLCSLYDERRNDIALTYTLLVLNIGFIGFMVSVVTREGSTMVRDQLTKCTERCFGNDCDPVAYFCPTDGSQSRFAQDLGLRPNSHRRGSTSGGLSYLLSKKPAQPSGSRKADFVAFPDI